MTVSPFDAMQAAVDIVNSSEHPTNKIAACVFGTTFSGDDFLVRAVNHWPDAISSAFGRDIDIGDASGTIHAEMGCIIAAPATFQASIAITDPFCPNCAKNIAESGIKTIYIDHKGFDKDWTARRVDEFTDLSLRIVERAGIRVCMIHRKDQKITPMITPSPGYIPPDDRPVHVIHPPTPLFDSTVLMDYAHAFTPDTRGLPFAAAFGRGMDHSVRILIAEEHVTIGYDPRSKSDQIEMRDTATGKYTFLSTPINRLMMSAARMGYKIDPRLIVSSRIPTSRELVNMVAAGLTNLHILNVRTARDKAAQNGLDMLVKNRVITLS